MTALLSIKAFIICSLLFITPLLVAKATNRKLTFSTLTNLTCFGAITIALFMLTYELANVDSWQQFGMNLAPIIAITLFGVLTKVADTVMQIAIAPRGT